MAKVWTPHLAIAWGGRLGTPALDSWVNTLHGIVTAPGGALDVLSKAEQDTWATAAAPLFNTWHIATTNPISSASALLDYVKANSVGADGKYVYPVSTVYSYPTPAGGGGAAANWRDSLVMTLRTDHARGRAHAGRFYPPAFPSQPGTNSPYISTTLANAVLARLKTLLLGLQAITLGSGKAVAIAAISAGLTDIGLDPAYNVITKVEADLTPDTQRRRTNRVPRTSVSLVLF